MFSEKSIRIILKSLIIVLSLVGFIAVVELLFVNLRDGRITDENRFQLISGHIRILSVSEGGASDRAGILPGDILLAIDDIEFKDEFKADSYLRSKQAGDEMVYTIKRDDQILYLTVVAAKQSISFYHFLGALLFLMFVSLALFLALKDEIKIIGLVFSLSLILIAMVCSISIFVFSNGILTPTLVYFLIFGISIGNAMFMHSHFYLSNKVDLRNEKAVRLFIKIYYILSVILLVVSILKYVNTGNFNFNADDIFGVLLRINVVLNCLISLVLIIFFHKIYLKSIVHISIITLVIWLYYAAALIIGGFLFFRGLQEAILVFTPIVYIPLFYAYIISKNNSFGIKQVLKQNIQYRFSYVAIWFFIIILFYTLIKNLSEIDFGTVGVILGYNSIEFGETKQPGFTDRPIFIMAGFVSVFFLLGVRKHIKNFLSKMFNRRDYDYKKAFNEISALIASTENISELYEKVLMDLIHFMNLKSMVLYTKNDRQFELQNSVGLTKHEVSSIRHFIEVKEFTHRQQVPMDMLKNVFDNAPESLQYAIPMTIKTELLGILLVGEKRSEDNFNQTDFDFFDSFNRQFLVVIENMRLQKEKLKSDFLNREIQLAKDIQINLLPGELPDINGLDIAGFYKAANYVGGDYYDFLYDKQIDDDIVVVLGDVSGKGVSASLYMSRFQGVMRSFYHAGLREPKALIESTNAMVCSDIAKSSFVTCICLGLNPKKKIAKIVRAGHLPLLMYSAKEKKIKQISPQGLGLGLSNSNVFKNTLQEAEVKYESGDIFLLYSDGITEAMNNDKKEFGFDRLESAISTMVNNNADEIKESLNREIQDFIKTDVSNDDITYVVIKAC